VANSDVPPDSSVDSGSGTAAFLDALNVSRNAKIGLVVGIAFAALIYVIRVFELLGPARREVGGPILYLGLAFVLAFGTFVLVTMGLTLISAYRRTRELS
jgi:predicted transporter